MMNVEKIKRVLLITLGMITATMGYYIWSYNREKTPPQPIIRRDVDEKADVVATDVELTEMTNDRTLWMLIAREAKVYNTLKETHLKDIDVDFFDEQGKSMHLKSDRGVKDDKTGNIIASGNVQATSYREGAVLKTSELLYDASINKVTSDKHVIIERGNVITSGDGLESDVSLSEAKILRNVTTSFVAEQ
jgi:LPS export ABC transporter protein LptC